MNQGFFKVVKKILMLDASSLSTGGRKELWVASANYEQLLRP